MFELDISNQQVCVPVDVQELRQALLLALDLEAVTSAALTIQRMPMLTLKVSARQGATD